VAVIVGFVEVDVGIAVGFRSVLLVERRVDVLSIGAISAAAVSACVKYGR